MKRRKKRRTGRAKVCVNVDPRGAQKAASVVAEETGWGGVGDSPTARQVVGSVGSRVRELRMLQLAWQRAEAERWGRQSGGVEITSYASASRAGMGGVTEVRVPTTTEVVYPFEEGTTFREMQIAGYNGRTPMDTWKAFQIWVQKHGGARVPEERKWAGDNEEYATVPTTPFAPPKRRQGAEWELFRARLEACGAKQSSGQRFSVSKRR